MKLINHWLAGAEDQTAPERTQPVYDPATGEQTAELALGGQDVVDRAVANAREAFKTWGRMSLAKRMTILHTFRNLVLEHADEMAEIISRQHGKTVSDARGEIARGLETVEFASGIGAGLKGEFSTDVSTGVDVHSLRQPLGVVAGITPFNFPAMVPMWMYPLAIATGNTFILKPSERDPGASMLVAELWKQAGLPDGVFQVVHGGKDAVDAILTHPGISAVSFVGSTPIARHVQQLGITHGKRVQALGGANNHGVVLPDADLDFAASQIVSGAFGSAGERCMALPVAVAVGGIGEQLVELVKAKAEALVVGKGYEKGTDMGPVITPEAKQRIVTMVDEAERDGATIVLDGRGLVVDGCEGGNFVGPTVVDGATPEMRVYAEEVFGPVLTIMHVDTFEDAVELVNASPYGNGSAIFTSSGEYGRRYANEVTAGMVGINVPIPTPVAYYSFGGWKDSLLGDHHAHGPEAVRFYTRAKVVTTRWPHTGDVSRVDMNFPANTN